jgi:hypothetical protein
MPYLGGIRLAYEMPSFGFEIALAALMIALVPVTCARLHRLW